MLMGTAAPSSCEPLVGVSNARGSIYVLRAITAIVIGIVLTTIPAPIALPLWAPTSRMIGVQAATEIAPSPPGSM